MNYEQDYSHSHCWDQEVPACGIPKEKHKQCCLCPKWSPEYKSDFEKFVEANPVKESKPDDWNKTLAEMRESAPLPTEAEWEIDFDNRRYIDISIGDPGWIELKSFISSLLASQLDSIEAMVKNLEWYHKTDGDSEINVIFGKLFEELTKMRNP